MKINPGFIMICSLVVFAPLTRGFVYLWAETLIQIVALSGIFVMLVSRIGSQKLAFKRNSLDKPLAALVVFVALTALLSDYPWLAAEGAILFFSYIAIYYIAVNSIKTRKEQRLLIYVIVGTALFISMIAVLKRFDMNPFFFWEYHDLAYPKIFLSGTYGNHNHFAGFLGMVIPMLLCLLFIRKRSREKNLLIIGCVMVLLVLLTFTFSRGGWISTFLALLFMIWVVFKKNIYGKSYLIRTILSVFIVFILVLVSTPVFQRMAPLVQESRLDHVRFRLEVWESSTALIKDHPFTGTGPGTFAQAFPFYTPAGLDVLPVFVHNDYLQFIADTGFVFIPLGLWLLFAFFKTGLAKLRSRSRQTRGITLGAMTSVFAVLVHTFFDFNLHIPANALLFTVLAALVCTEPKIRVQRRRSE